MRLLQEAGYTTATGRPEQSSDLAHGAGSIHDSSNSTPATMQSRSFRTFSENRAKSNAGALAMNTLAFDEEAAPP